MVEAVVLELEDTDVAVRRGTGEEAAGLVRGPSDDVDRGLVEGEVVDSLPLVVLGALFFPDEDLAIVPCRRQDVAVFGMRPGDAPDGAFVTSPKPD